MMYKMADGTVVVIHPDIAIVLWTAVGQYVTACEQG